METCCNNTVSNRYDDTLYTDNTNVKTEHGFEKYCKVLNLKEKPVGRVTYIQKK